MLRVLLAQLRDLVVQRIHAPRRSQLLIVGAVAVAQLLQNPHVLLQPVHCYRAEACVLSQGPATLRAFFRWDLFHDYARPQPNGVCASSVTGGVRKLHLLSLA